MIIISFLSISITFFSFYNIYAQQSQQPLSEENITLYDSNLKIELVTSGLDFPTTMAFLGPDDFLILEKNTGNVKKVINTTLVEKPLLNLNPNIPSIKDERGLLGIAISEKKKNSLYDALLVKNDNLTHNVFLYHIVCKDMKKNTNCENRVYRYDLDNKNNILVNPKLLISLANFKL
jgi:hypothetical protein